MVSREKEVDPVNVVERHPWEPFLPPQASLLMLGSFPPPRARWSMDFYYPNLQNDMWRIFGLLFFGQRDYFLTPDRKHFDLERLKPFLQSRGIALYDTAVEVIRHKGNASDQFLEVVTPLDFDVIFTSLPVCRAIAVTGQKAMNTLLTHLDAQPPKVGGSSSCFYDGRPLRLYRLPSSSRAYPLSIERKAEVYGQMFRELGLLPSAT